MPADEYAAFLAAFRRGNHRREGRAIEGERKQVTVLFADSSPALRDCRERFLIGQRCNSIH
jgi:hypothetical protein